MLRWIPPLEALAPFFQALRRALRLRRCRRGVELAHAVSTVAVNGGAKAQVVLQVARCSTIITIIYPGNREQQAWEGSKDKGQIHSRRTSVTVLSKTELVNCGERKGATSNAQRWVHK